MNLGPSIRQTMLADPLINSLIGDTGTGKSIFTIRPVPPTAGFPIGICDGDVTVGNEDLLNELIPVPIRDISIFGEVKKQHEAVETIAYRVREIFHRERTSLSLDGYTVISVVATGPFSGPVEDEKYVSRIVSLTVRLQKQ